MVQLPVDTFPETWYYTYMMMIDIEINDNAFSATVLEIEAAEHFFARAEILSDYIENWRMNVYFGSVENRELKRSYGSNHPVNAAADFAECIAMERETMLPRSL